ncbi:MAG: response regulator [Bacteroidota bacterium]
MKKILVVEDDKMIRESLTEILTMSGYTIQTAENGKVGLAEALTFDPDLIICDVSMPEMDGYEFIRVIRSVPQFGEVPFIFLTALASPHDFRKGMDLGADDFLTKPFSPDELMGVIQRKLERFQRMRKEREEIEYKLQKVVEKVENLQFFNSHRLRGPISNMLGMLQQSNAFEQQELIHLLQVEAEKVDQVLTEINDQLRVPELKQTANCIYLIDDDPLQHRLNKRLIERIQPDAMISHFYNGFEALAAFQDAHRASPDLVFLDLNMPVMNGMEVLQAFQSLPNPPLIFILSSSIDHREMKQVNTFDFVNGFLHKPLQPPQLNAIFSRHF